MIPARPRVSLHFAQSLDGRIAMPETQAVLSSREGVELAHRARAEHDAVLVGSRTVHIDDPQLTVRFCEGLQPRRVVLASTLAIPLAARVLRPGPGVLVIGVEGRASSEARDRLGALGVDVRLVPAGSDGLVSLVAALAVVREWGVGRLLVEGGGRMLTAFVRERLADEATIEIALRVYGSPALAAFGSIGVGSADQALGFVEPRIDRAGPNLVVRGRIAY